MPSSSQDQVQGLNFSGYFRARVVKNDDPMMEGRLGVFIPSLITEIPNNLEAPKSSVGTVSTTLFANQSELGLSRQVKKDNFIWARPGDFLVENGGGASNHGGTYQIPNVGTMVRVYFENEDPNKPYWILGSPTVNGDVIAGTNLGKGTNVQAAAANWQDPAKRTKIHVVAEYDNGNIVYVDSNGDNNAFVLRWANGHTLSVGHAAESGIILQTEKGHLVQLDENSGEIRLSTHTGQASVILKDDGTIAIQSAKSIDMRAGQSIKLSAPRIDLN